MKFVLCFVLLFITISCHNESVKTTKIWRFALEEIEGSVQFAYAEKFKELIEAKTNNKIKVEVYPYGTIGTSDQITELIATGALQFAMASPGYLGKLIPEVQIFLLHYLLSPNDDINMKLLSPSGDIVNFFKTSYSEKGFELLDFYPEGWQVWTLNKSVKSPGDFNGVKMRVMTSPLLLKSYAAYGASPTPMPYAEVYSGLQLKMIDGQVNPIFAIEEMSFYEVTDYLIFPKHAQFVTSVVTGKKFYNRLNKNEKQLVIETIKELNQFIFEKQKEFNSKRLAIIKEKKPDINIIRLSHKQQNAFKEKAKSVRNDFIEMAGERGKMALELFDRELKILTGQ